GGLSGAVPGAGVRERRKELRSAGHALRFSGGEQPLPLSRDPEYASTADRLLLAALYGGVDRPVYLERLPPKTAKPLRRGPRGFLFCLGGHHLPGSGAEDWRRRVAVSSKQKEAGWRRAWVYSKRRPS